MDRWHYLLVLAACLAVTSPLELLGARVYRPPVRAVRAILPAAGVFLAWDVLATAAGVWDFNGRYLVGVELPFGLPLEELLFFLVVPLCGLLTYGCVQAMLAKLRANGTER